MFKNILQNRKKAPIRQKSGEFLLCQSNQYLSALQKLLSKQVDERYVRTFYDTFIAILMFRNRAMGLLLSELGGFISGFEFAPAGTKRISRLLGCKKWSHKIVDDFFFKRAKERIIKLKSCKKRPLLLWDDSRIEKSESTFLGGLCSVFSSKAQRLTRIRPGFFTPPGNRICTTGYKWTGIMLSALGEVPSVFNMTWWTTRGKHKEQGTNIIYQMLSKIHQQTGRTGLHVFDRGYANANMLEWLEKFEQDFLIRWVSNHQFVNQEGKLKKIYNIARSYKAKHSKQVNDKERKKYKTVTIAWAPVQHPEFVNMQLYLIIIRDKNNNNSPIYLITNVPINDRKTAWEMCFSYIHRWEIEQTFRCCKSELGMESPRLWFFDRTLKLLAIVSLVYDFLLKMLGNWKPYTKLLFKKWGHRTGNRYRKAAIPIYRLRAAVSMTLHALFFEKHFERLGWFDRVT
jgi:hypothetical protein